jgi:dCMP deaminase
LLQAKVHTIYYIHDWAHPIDSLQEQYLLAQSKLPGGVRKVEIQDPEAEWANGNAAPIEVPSSNLGAPTILPKD